MHSVHQSPAISRMSRKGWENILRKMNDHIYFNPIKRKKQIKLCKGDFYSSHNLEN